MDQLDKLLGLLVGLNGSDLHIQSGSVPRLRVEGKLQNVDMLPMSSHLVDNLKDTMDIRDVHLGKLIDDLSADFKYVHEAYGVFRVNISHCQMGMKITMRNLNRKILPLNTLGFEDGIFDEILDMKQGLVILTGSTNSGKSTTLASLVHELNQRGKNIITLEDPIEYIFKEDLADLKTSLITQRELGYDFKDYPSAIKTALRQDPDVIMVGEMRDKETIKATLLAAETGHLVLTTLHTNGVDAIKNRIILPFDSYERNELSLILDETLTLGVHQELIHNPFTKKLELSYDYKKFKE